MDSFYRPTWVEISLDALGHNLREFRRVLPEGIALMAVVKADAYGHGAINIAREALRHGVRCLAVAFLDEALELRRAGIDAPILVLGYTPVEGVALALEYGITLNVFTSEVLLALAAAAKADRPARIHIKVDTGMGRIGIHVEEDAIAFIEQALKLPGVVVEGLFTHYASADEADKTYTNEQYAKFERIVNHFDRGGVRFEFLHAGNSATAIDQPELTCNMVRLGISMYGLYPSREVRREKLALQPVMSLKTRMVLVKEMPPGAGISYGTIYRTKRAGERIATLPIGYADGYSRMLTGKAEALVGGSRVPVVGTICMDQCMIDIDGVPDAQAGDEVVLFGRQGEAGITAEEIADKLGTINYEVTCMISHRVPRVYVKDGEVCNTVNLLQHHAD
ncbi:MAG: alanine racemase [Paenibacillaceae bacterium]|nr:alanine racemase [Paenibacillaceae bacterium]